MQARGDLVWMGPGADRIGCFFAVAARTPLRRGARPDAVAGYHRAVRAGDRSFLVPGPPPPQARLTTVDFAVARLQARVRGNGITGTSARCQGIDLGGHRHGLVRSRAKPRDADAPLHPVARLLLLDGEMTVAVTTRIPAGRWARGPTLHCLAGEPGSPIFRIWAKAGVVASTGIKVAERCRAVLRSRFMSLFMHVCGTPQASQDAEGRFLGGTGKRCGSGAARLGRDVPLQVSLFAHPLRGLLRSLPGHSAGRWKGRGRACLCALTLSHRSRVQGPARACRVLGALRARLRRP